MSTRRLKAGEWLQKAQGNIAPVKAIESEEEVELFVDLLLKKGYLPNKGEGKPKWEAMCEAWNEEV